MYAYTSELSSVNKIGEQQSIYISFFFIVKPVSLGTPDGNGLRQVCISICMGYGCIWMYAYKSELSSVNKIGKR